MPTEVPRIRIHAAPLILILAASHGVPSAADASASAQAGSTAATASGAKKAGGKTAAGAALSPGMVLRINGKEIPRARFIEELTEVLGDSYRETFISHVLLDEKAKALGISATGDEVEAFVRRTVDQVQQERFEGDAARLDAALSEQGMTLQGWKRRLRIDGRYDVLTEKLVRKERAVADEEVKRLFEEKYGKDGVQIKVRHIQKSVQVAASQDYTLQQYEQEKVKIEEEARVRAEEALSKLKSGESFDAVMAAYSDDPRKASGGLLGAWKGRFGPELDKAASELEKDAISGVVKAADGYRIVQCTGIVETEELHALHILVGIGPRGKGRSDEEAKKKADDLLARIKAGEDFAQLAKDNSDDPASAQRGGDLGYFGRRSMVKPFEDAAFALAPGQVSDAVKTVYGYHVIKSLDQRKSQDRTLRQILVSTQFALVKDRRLRPGLEAKVKGELESALKELKAPGATFADIAKRYSDDASTKDDGGLLKPYREGVYGGEFDRTVKASNAGEEPRIAKDAAGNMHIVLVEGIVKTNFEDVRAALHDELMQRPISRQEKADYTSKLREAASVVS